MSIRSENKVKVSNCAQGFAALTVLTFEAGANIKGPDVPHFWSGFELEGWSDKPTQSHLL